MDRPKGYKDRGAGSRGGSKQLGRAVTAREQGYGRGGAGTHERSSTGGTQHMEGARMAPALDPDQAHL